MSVLVYALAALEISWTTGRIMMFLAMLIAGTVIFASVWVCAVRIVFWAVEGGETATRSRMAVAGTTWRVAVRHYRSTGG